MASGEGAFRPDIPSTARMYDYMLGGKDNYPADREAAQRTFDAVTEEVVRGTVSQNRKFLGRAVRYLAAELGIRQFLDIGTGLPSMNNVHEVAQSVATGTRVVYVDNDPVVIAHARDMLNDVPGSPARSSARGGQCREPSRRCLSGTTRMGAVSAATCRATCRSSPVPTRRAGRAACAARTR